MKSGRFQTKVPMKVKTPVVAKISKAFCSCSLLWNSKSNRFFSSCIFSILIRDQKGKSYCRKNEANNGLVDDDQVKSPKEEHNTSRSFFGELPFFVHFYCE